MQDEHQEQDLDLSAGSGTADPDPLAQVPSEPIEDVSEAPEEERLGGEGAAIGEEEVLQEPEESEVELEPESEREPHASEGMELPPVEEAAEAAAAAEPEPKQAEAPAKAEAPPAEKAEASAAATEPEKPKSKPREYQILRVLDDESIQQPMDEPLKARNGDEAIKAAYKALTKNPEEDMTLVAVPTGYWNPKKVKGKKKEDYAVTVG